MSRSTILALVATTFSALTLAQAAGYSGTDIGHAGIQTARGRVAWCAPNDGAVMRLEKGGTRTAIANSYRAGVVKKLRPLTAGFIRGWEPRPQDEKRG
jgi:hypothetical protein